MTIPRLGDEIFAMPANLRRRPTLPMPKTLAQYGLTNFQAGIWIPATAATMKESLPTWHDDGTAAGFRGLGCAARPP